MELTSVLMVGKPLNEFVNGTGFDWCLITTFELSLLLLIKQNVLFHVFLGKPRCMYMYMTAQ